MYEDNVLLNPDNIYHSICVFANDYNNDGDGYIVVGVEEENGIAKRTVKGLPEYMLDTIQKVMVGYNNTISPPYFPQGIPAEVDGKWIVTINKNNKKEDLFDGASILTVF